MSKRSFETSPILRAGQVRAFASMEFVPVAVEPVTRAAPNGADADFQVVMSTENVASDRMVVLAEAWREGLPAFMRNPVLLWAHDYDEEPVGRLVEVAIVGRTLVGWVKFDENDEDAVRIREKYRNGFLNAFSVGFLIESLLEGNELTPAQLQMGARYVVTKARLLELSCVPVPADAAALIAGRAEVETVEAAEVEPPATLSAVEEPVAHSNTPSAIIQDEPPTDSVIESAGSQDADAVEREPDATDEGDAGLRERILRAAQITALARQQARLSTSLS